MYGNKKFAPSAKLHWVLVFTGVVVVTAIIFLDTSAFPLSQSGTIRKATIRGRVVKIEAESARITLAHEPVPALEMDAMTMPFRVNNVRELTGLLIGDVVTATVYEEIDAGRMWLEKIKQQKTAAPKSWARKRRG